MFKNPCGGLTIFDFKEHDDYESAYEFYSKNKMKLKEKGIYIEVESIDD